MKKSLLTALLCSVISLPTLATEVNIQTSMGDIRVDLNDQEAPKTVENFLRYVDEGFYEGLIFHRVIKGFMIQGGGFDKDLDRQQAHHAIPYEGDNGLKNYRGTLAMARTKDPNSATSQFFINQIDNTYLNHKTGHPGYTVFGHVISGLDVVDKISGVTTRNIDRYQNVPVTPVIIEKITRVE